MVLVSGTLPERSTGWAADGEILTHGRPGTSALLQYRHRVCIICIRLQEHERRLAMAGGISHQKAATKSEMQDTVTIMITTNRRKAEIARFVHTDRIVGRLGDFPQLTKAVRDGDLATVSILCAQLFDSNCLTKVRPNPLP
jgi:hypothetical protein